MNFESNGYLFKPHELPMMAGSPASPDHHLPRRIAYLLIGLLLALNAGLQNGLLLASLPQLRGELGLTLEQTGWIQVSFYMTYACMGILFFRIRQHFGVSFFVRWTLLLLLMSNLLQLLLNDYRIELVCRGLSGIASNGLMVLGLFYVMQSLSGKAKLLGAIIAMGSMQLGSPIAQLLIPFLFADGEMVRVFVFQLILTLFSIGFVLKLPMPPSLQINVLNRLDLLSFMLFASGIALLCGFLVQGRIIWWDEPSLGIMLAVSVLLIGSALFIESQRKAPMLDWHWLSAPQILAFGLIGAMVRILTAEQTVGAAGLLNTLGMSNEQLLGFYTVLLLASIFGLILSILTLKMQDIRRSVSIALFGIMLGAWLDTQIGVQTRPSELYLSQAILAFSSLYFLGPMLLEGLIRAIAKSPNHIMSFSAIFGLSQTLGGLAGASLFSAFLTYRTREHLASVTQHFSLTDAHFATSLKLIASLFSPISNDPQFLQRQAVSSSLNLAIKEATVLAYQDLFLLIALCAGLAFVYSLVIWGYRKYKGIILLQQELATLMAIQQSRR